MTSVRRIFARRILELACDGDAAGRSPLARAVRRLPSGFFVKLAEAAEGKN